MFLTRSRNRGEAKPLRVLIAPVEVGGFYSNLERALENVGHEVTLVYLQPEPRGYAANTTSDILIRRIQRLNALRASGRALSPIRVTAALLSEVLSFAWFLSSLHKYDAYIFGFGQSLTPLSRMDLRLLKRLGKTLVINIAHGSEARPPFANGAFSKLNNRQVVKAIKRVKKTVRLSERFGTYVIGSPMSTAPYARRPFLNSFMLGNPVMLEAPHTQRESDLGKTPLRIVHVPSSALTKGSEGIAKVMAELSTEGHNFVFDVVSGVPHEVVQQHLSNADLVIDQLYSDTPLPGLSQEAMAQGCAVVIGGYGLDYLETLVPSLRTSGAITCKPENLKETVRSVFLDPAKIDESRRLGQRFLNRYWSFSAVGQNFSNLLNGLIPVDWWVDPEPVQYLMGVGMSEREVKSRIANLVNSHGVSSLGLDDKPKWKDAFLLLANGKVSDDE